MRNEEGISLVELVLVIAAVGFAALLIGNLPSSISSITKSRHISQARDIAGKEVDTLRKLTFDGLALTGGPVAFNDPSLSDLPASAATYEIDSCPEDICTNSEDVKEVKVVVNWNEEGDAKKVELDTLVAEGGLNP